MLLRSQLPNPQTFQNLCRPNAYLIKTEKHLIQIYMNDVNQKREDNKKNSAKGNTMTTNGIEFYYCIKRKNKFNRIKWKRSRFNDIQNGTKRNKCVRTIYGNIGNTSGKCLIALTDALMLNKLHTADAEYLTSYIAYCASFAKAEEEEEDRNRKEFVSFEKGSDDNGDNVSLSSSYAKLCVQIE